MAGFEGLEHVNRHGDARRQFDFSRALRMADAAAARRLVRAALATDRPYALAPKRPLAT